MSGSGSGTGLSSPPPNATVLKVAAALATLLAAPAGAETLRFFPPAGFTGVHVSDSGTVKLTEYVRDGETLDGWTHAVTIAELRGTGQSAADYVARVSTDLQAACRAAFHLDPELDDAGGRRSTMSVHACPNLDISGRSEVSLLRVIEGRDGTLFALQRAWVVTPPRADLDSWTEILRAVQVCDNAGCS